MKIAWVGPYCRRSAIGHYSQLVTREMVKRDVDVAIIRSELDETLETHDAPAPGVPIIHALTDQAKDIVNNSDVVFYNIGNNFSYHGHVFDETFDRTGIMVAHDVVFAHSYIEYLEHRKEDWLPLYVDEVERWHGAATARSIRNDLLSPRSEAFWREQVFRLPLFEWALAKGTAVFTHSAFAAEAFSHATGLPVGASQLAYIDPPSALAKWGEILPGVEDASETDEANYKICMFGDVNYNKRVESVIAVIGGSADIADRVTLRIVGSISASVRDELTALASRGESDVSIEFTGRVSDDDYVAFMKSADLICCLRWPPSEAGSASVVEAMLSGAATVVTDIGCYADIPDGLVLKVRPDAELEDLEATFRRLLEEGPRNLTHGNEARAWALDRHSAATYVDALFEFVEAVEPTIGLIEAIHDIVGQACYFSAGARPQLIRELAVRVEELAP